jgi:hypothetical protein
MLNTFTKFKIQLVHIRSAVVTNILIDMYPERAVLKLSCQIILLNLLSLSTSKSPFCDIPCLAIVLLLHLAHKTALL